MDAIVDLSWRMYPASAAMAAGVTLAAHGVRTEVAAWRTHTAFDPMRALLFVQGFRLAVIGITLTGTGAAWLWHIEWLFWLSVIVMGEETFETTLVIGGLRYGQRLQADMRRTRASRANWRSGRSSNPS